IPNSKPDRQPQYPSAHAHPATNSPSPQCLKAPGCFAPTHKSLRLHLTGPRFSKEPQAPPDPSRPATASAQQTDSKPPSRSPSSLSNRSFHGRARKSDRPSRSLPHSHKTTGSDREHRYAKSVAPTARDSHHPTDAG